MVQEAKEANVSVQLDAVDMIRGFGRKFEDVLKEKACKKAQKRNPENPKVIPEDVKDAFKKICGEANPEILGQCNVVYCENPAVEGSEKCIIHQEADKYSEVIALAERNPEFAKRLDELFGSSDKSNRKKN